LNPLKEVQLFPVECEAQASRKVELPVYSALRKGAIIMNDREEHVYKTIQLTGSSKTSIEDAVERAITKASQTIRQLRWFEVVETRGYIEDGKLAYWQVTVKIGFTRED
jgi:dodecin